MDINPRGKSLMQYMVSTKLNILNEGNEPTFLNIRRRQVIDLTLGTTLVGNPVSDWHVSSEESLSHRYICFKIQSQVFETVIYTATPRRLIGLDIDKTFQLSLGAFQRTYVRGWTWSWPLMKCSSPFS